MNDQPHAVAVRRHVVIRGRVQGVWFRDSCRTEALRRGVTGWVRNRADGSVEAVFEGPAASVDELVAWCRQGPPRARVEGIEELRGGEPEGLTTFDVR